MCGGCSQGVGAHHSSNSSADIGLDGASGRAAAVSAVLHPWLAASDDSDGRDGSDGSRACNPLGAAKLPAAIVRDGGGVLLIAALLGRGSPLGGRGESLKLFLAAPFYSDKPPVRLGKMR